jgi:asparagine synthase (glutamine-hydrolysing)
MAQNGSDFLGIGYAMNWPPRAADAREYHEAPSRQACPAGEPYVVIKRAGGESTFKGVAECFLGHRIPRPGSQHGDDGIFAGWKWDGAVLRAYNDRYGMFPLYYFQTGSEVGLSTSILQLLSSGAPRDLDYEALAVFLRFGLLGADTPFAGIRALPPKTRFEWRDGKSRIEDGMRLVDVLPLSRQAALDAYISLFRQSMRRRPPSAEGAAIPLSGGRDSRHILFELCAAGHRPKLCVTARYSPPGDTAEAEIDVASRLAKMVNLPHVVIDQNRSQYRTEWRSNAETDFCATSTSWMLPVADYLKGKVRHIYDGIGGDVLSAGLFLTARRLELYRARKLRELAGDLMQAEPHPAMFAPSVSKLLRREVAVERFIRELERHTEAPNPIGSFIFWNRTRRRIAMTSYRILSRAGEVLAPYVDHDLFDLLSALPAETFLDHSFHTAAIEEAYPQYAGIPYAAPCKRAIDSTQHAAARRFALDLVLSSMRHGRSALVQRRFLLARLFRCMVDREYSVAINWLGEVMLYLLQLEDVVVGRHDVPIATAT